MLAHRRPHPPHTANAAFTLIEMAVVVMVIGLILGGIVAGGNILHATNLKRITVDLDEYSTAIRQFNNQYQAQPGDMFDATQYWGAQVGSANTFGVISGCDNSLLTPANGRATCNGDGNGKIGRLTSEHYEMYRAWQHLHNAGLIRGDEFAGVPGSNADTLHHIAGYNAPSGPLNGTSYAVQTRPEAVHTTSWDWPHGEIPALIFGGEQGTTLPFSAALTPRELYEIDRKADDGAIQYGKIRSRKANGSCHDCTGSCNTVTAVQNATYNLDNDNVGCVISYHYTLDPNW